MVEEKEGFKNAQTEISVPSAPRFGRAILCGLGAVAAGYGAYWATFTPSASLELQQISSSMVSGDFAKASLAVGVLMSIECAESLDRRVPRQAWWDVKPEPKPAKLQKPSVAPDGGSIKKRKWAAMLTGFFM